MITEKKWEERIRDPHAECMSEEERRILQGEKLRKLVKRVYGTVPFYTEKMKELGVEPGDIKSIEDITKLPFTTKDDLRDNYPFGFLAVPNEQVVRVQGTSGTTGKLTVIGFMSVMDTACLQEEWGLISARRNWGPWQFPCQREIRNAS